MLFSKKKKKRVEPRFEDAPRGTDISVTEDDRVLPSQGSKRTRAKNSGSARKASATQRPRKSSKATQPKAARRKPAEPRGAGRSSGRARRGFFGGLIYWTFVLGIWGGIGVAGIVGWYALQMPSASTWKIPDRPPNVKIVSVNGTLLANRGVTGGQALGLHEMSPYIPQAVVAIEDRRYFSHFGVDPIGLTRAMMRNVASGRVVQGGSTLTQQLAKNLFLSQERTMGRKVQEVLLALWLEQKYSKEQILEMYLNRVYFGSGAHGVEAASRRYFNKPARDVNLQEAALLAGLLKAPSRLSPAKDPQAAEERAQVVLAAMREQNMVSDTEMTEALSRKTTKAASYWDGSQHYVADAVMAELPKLVPDIKSDVIVDTTVDLVLQKFAEDSIRELIADNGEKKNVSQGALVSIDGTGAVRALVGGLDYATSQFNRAVEAKRQPGSTFKPFVYLTAVENGMTPDSVVNDHKVKFGKWSPDNYGDKYYGAVTLKTALSKSLNSVAAQLIMQYGADQVADNATRIGITSKLNRNASLALGTSEVSLFEMTSAYAAFSTGGWRVSPHIIRRVTDMDGNILYEANPEPVRVMAVQTAGMMNEMMTGTVEEGTGRAADIGRPAAGKTGTSQNSRDAWFIGYTANLTTGVWFGNDDGEPMKDVTGGSLPAKAWNAFMAKAHQGVAVVELPRYRPDPVVAVGTDSEPTGATQMITDTALGAPVEAKGDFPPPPPAPQRDRTVLDILLGR